jgi:hypothetical protein
VTDKIIDIAVKTVTRDKYKALDEVFSGREPRHMIYKLQKNVQTNSILLYRRMCKPIQFFCSEERAN